MKSTILSVVSLLSLLLATTFINAQSPVLSFDGVDDFVNLGNAGNNIRTFELWFSPADDIDNSTSSTQTLFARETEGGNTREEFDLFFWSGDGNLKFLYRPSGSAAITIESDNDSWTAGQWYHVAIVIHPTDGLTMFVDGVLQASTNAGHVAPTETILGTLSDDFTALGVWGEFNDRFFKGQMEDVRFSTEALYSSNFTPPCPSVGLEPSTTGLWNLNNIGGATVAVNLGTSGDGIINGASWSEATICDGVTQCICRAIVKNESTSSVSVNGNQSINININTQGETVTSVCIELPYYVSKVDPSCLKCELPNLGSNGTIQNGSNLLGVTGTLDDPFGLGYSRKICYEFSTPTVINNTIQLNLKFPAVLALACCENKVDFCLDVELKKEDCTVCEYNICYQKEDTSKVKSIVNDSDLNLETAVATMIEKPTLLVYPNPTSSNISVTIDCEKFENGQAKLTSLDGKVVHQKQVNSNRFEMKLNHIDAGTYILIVSNNEQKISKRIVIN